VLDLQHDKKTNLSRRRRRHRDIGVHLAGSDFDRALSPGRRHYWPLPRRLLQRSRHFGRAVVLLRRPLRTTRSLKIYLLQRVLNDARQAIFNVPRFIAPGSSRVGWFWGLGVNERRAHSA